MRYEMARRFFKDLLRYFIMAVLLVFFGLPFVWMVLCSFKTPAELLAIPIRWVPAVPQWSNYSYVVTMMPFGRAFLNSSIVTVSICLLVLATSTAAGFALSKYEFRGREAYFTFILATMTIPAYIVLIPRYYIVFRLGWINSYASLIVPAVVYPFGIFFMRQFISSMVPDELVDASRIDGCSELGVFTLIVLPLCKPAWMVLGVLVFMFYWNDFLWPLVVINDERLYTIQLWLSSLNDNMGSLRFYPLLMAGTTLAIIPGTIIFLLTQKQIVRGIALTGFK